MPSPTLRKVVESQASLARTRFSISLLAGELLAFAVANSEVGSSVGGLRGCGRGAAPLGPVGRKGNGIIEKIEVRGGLPRRIVFAVPLPDALPLSVSRLADSKKDTAKKPGPG